MRGSGSYANLSPDKDAVLAGVQRLLKPGGEFYFSDVYADRRVPVAVKNDPVLYGECLGGALYWNDFVRLAKRHGFADYALVHRADIIGAVEDGVINPAAQARRPTEPAALDIGQDLTQELWDNLNSKMVDYMQSITLRSLVLPSSTVNRVNY